MVQAKPYYIFDLDGTLADTAHRIHHISGPEKDWNAFYEACKDDAPIESTLAILRSLHSQGYRIVILTGRSEVVQSETVQWLAEHGVFRLHMMVMRPDGDFRPDHVLKSQWVRELALTPDNVLGIFEDRERVVRMWRKKGYTCYQVDEGNF